MQITIGRIETRKGRTRQLGVSTAVVLLVHALMFWGFAVMRPKILNLPQPDYIETLPVELWEVPPEISPPPPVPRPVPQPAPEAQSAPEAQPAPSPQIIPKPSVTPAPVPVPVPQPQVVPKPQPVAEPIPVPVSRPAPALKAKHKDDDVLAKTSPADITAVSDLKLHQAPDVVVPGIVAPSGLTDASQGSNQKASGGAAGGGALQGFGLKGRGVITQAMQNHEYCISLQTAGKPIPPTCQMADLASHAPLGPRPDAGLQAAVARKDFDLKYKTAPGNSDYWNRVVHVPTAADHIDPAPVKGAYSSQKAQRTMGDCSVTDSCAQ